MTTFSSTVPNIRVQAYMSGSASAERLMTLAPFFDAGLNKIVFANQLKVNKGQIASLNDQFTQAAFTDKVKIAAGIWLDLK